ncbi:hypothetical protein AWZ03_004694 [Drosophila navojoa]|uniref:Uncharacterized protein n=1 Tax=Drosophila navojoa TaxID=7232 RepID=A0A484BM26_DRONA|nr:hypothetical protein AWZ03_004694 [Drosophila navojoa]
MSGPIPGPNVNLKRPSAPTPTATAHASINYVFCRFVTFKGEAIKLPGEYYGESKRMGEPGIMYTQSHIIRINGHNMDMDMDMDMDMAVDMLLSVSIAHFAT